MPAMNRFRFLLVALLALLLAACGGMPHKKVDMVAEYGNAVRWSDWDTAWNFVDPAKRASVTLPEAEIERLKDVKVTGYAVRTRDPQPDGTVKQTVEIRYVDQATQREVSMRDQQVWRTDDDGEHWWITTGLPQF
jgi:hypothetical protein